MRKKTAWQAPLTRSNGWNSEKTTTFCAAGLSRSTPSTASTCAMVVVVLVVVVGGWGGVGWGQVGARARCATVQTRRSGEKPFVDSPGWGHSAVRYNSWQRWLMVLLACACCSNC